MSKAQPPDLARAQIKIKKLNKLLIGIDNELTAELEQTIAQEIDSSSQGEVETNAEHQKRFNVSNETRGRLELEFSEKRAKMIKPIQEMIEALTTRSYTAPIKLRLGTYNIDKESFPFFLKATIVYVPTRNDSGTLRVPPGIAKEFKVNISRLKQTGYWQLHADETISLAKISVTMGDTAFFADITSLVDTTNGSNLPPELSINSTKIIIQEYIDQRFFTNIDSAIANDGWMYHYFQFGITIDDQFRDYCEQFPKFHFFDLWAECFKYLNDKDLSPYLPYQRYINKIYSERYDKKFDLFDTKWGARAFLVIDSASKTQFICYLNAEQYDRHTSGHVYYIDQRRVTTIEFFRSFTSLTGAYNPWTTCK